jgi:beta-galactosidase
MVHCLPHWTWPGKEGQEIDVRCLSNCEEVELFLNGQSLGKKTMEKSSHLAWKLKYAPGALLAKGFKGGQAVAEDKVETAGAPAAIKLTPDRPSVQADGEDVSIITVAVTDAQGRVAPTAGNLVQFELSGPGRLLGVGNGDPSCHEADVFLGHSGARSVPVDGWRYREVPDTRDRPEIQPGYSVRNWRRVDVRMDLGPLEPNECAVFRTSPTLSEEDLAAANIVLHFGMIDDEGWVYVNGELAGESHDWNTAPAFPVKKFLKSGENFIAVVVKNNEGQGGINKGVTLQFQDKPVLAEWKRSVFNGLAQVLVRAGKDAGELKLTARAEGLAAATLTVPAEACVPRPVVP